MTIERKIVMTPSGLPVLVMWLRETTNPRNFVFAHGGAFVHEGYNTPPEVRFCERIAAYGFKVASVSYRLLDRAHLPAQIDDIEECIKTAFGDEPCVVSGCSAGSLGVQMLRTKTMPQIKGYVAISGCLVRRFIPLLKKRDKTKCEELFGISHSGGFESADGDIAMRKWLPEYHLSGTPDWLICQGENDDRLPVDHAKAMKVMLGGKCQLIIVPNQGHGLGAGELSVARIVSFSRTCLPQ